MRTSIIQNAVSFWLTGVRNPSLVLSSEPPPTQLSKPELDDLETTLEKYKQSQNENHKFLTPVFNLKTDLNTTQGQFRFVGLGVISSLFSGIGAGLINKTNYISGIVLGSLTLAASTLKKIPFLTTKFGIDSFGGNLIRNGLHVLDSIFSRTGEQAASHKIPSLFAGAVSLGSIFRSLSGKSNQALKLPIDTLSGTFGRTSIHTLDSFLSTEAIELFAKNQKLGAFLASTLITSGLLLPEKIKKKSLDYEVVEDLITMGSSSFTDSLFSSIGNVCSSALNNYKKLALGTVGVTFGMPLLGSILNLLGYQMSFNTFEGRLMKGILHAPESFAFNLGNTLGNTVLGIPISLGFAALTYFSCLSKKGSKLIKNFEIPSLTLGGQLQRIPLIHFMWSTISASALKLSNLIPAPLLVAIGPALSFQLGERFKNIPTKFNETKGLMVRSSIHFIETILMQAAYKTGKAITGAFKGEASSGSLLGGHWLTDDGRMVPSMAIGKQMNEKNENNLLGVLFSTIGGAVLAAGSFMLGKYFMKEKSKPIPKTIQSDRDTVNRVSENHINLKKVVQAHLHEQEVFRSSRFVRERRNTRIRKDKTWQLN